MKIYITYKKHPLDWAETEIEGEVNEKNQSGGCRKKAEHVPACGEDPHGQGRTSDRDSETL